MECALKQILYQKVPFTKLASCVVVAIAEITIFFYSATTLI